MTALPVGTCFTFRASAANDGPASLKIDALTAVPLVKRVKGDELPLQASDIGANQTVTACYDGTNMEIQSFGVPRADARYSPIVSFAAIPGIDQGDVAFHHAVPNATTFGAVSGTPVAGTPLTLELLGAVTPTTITFDPTYYAACAGVALPTSLAGGTTFNYFHFRYNAHASISKYCLVAMTTDVATANVFIPLRTEITMDTGPGGDEGVTGPPTSMVYRHDIAANVKMGKPTGTPTDGQTLDFELKPTVDNLLLDWQEGDAGDYAFEANLSKPTILTPANVYHNFRFRWTSSAGGGTGRWVLIARSTSSGGGHVIQNEGAPLAARTYLDFVGAGIDCATDDSIPGQEKTKCTIGGGTTSGMNFMASYSGASTISIPAGTHGQGQAVHVSVYDTSGVEIYPQKTLAGNGDVTLEFSVPTDVIVVIDGGGGAGMGTFQLSPNSIQWPQTLDNPAILDNGMATSRLLFDDDARECGVWQFIVPTDWAAGQNPIFVYQYGMQAGSGTGILQMDVQVMVLTDNDIFTAEDSYSAVNACDDTTAVPTIAHAGRTIQCTLTNNDGMVANKLARIKLCHDISAPNAVIGQIEVYGGRLNYTR